MKKIYLFVILLVSGFTFGQVNLNGEAHYILKSNVSLGDGATGGACGNGGLEWLYVSKSVGAPIYLKPNNGSDWQNMDYVFNDQEFTESSRIVSFTIRSKKRESYGLGNTSCHTTDSWETTKIIQRNQTDTYQDDRGVGGVLANSFPGKVTMSTYPIINLINPVPANNIIGTDSSIKIPVIEGVLPEYFEWMYHIDGEGYYRNRPFGGRVWVDTWRSLPSVYQGQASLNILCKDFLVREAVGKKITLRANVNGTTVELLYAKSAPHIDSVDAQQTICFDTNDGRAIVKFNSKLVEGETLTCSVSELDETGNIKEVVYSTQDNETVLIGDDLKYEIPYDLKKGKYKINLLGWYNEPNKVRANTYVMDLEHQKDFEITSAPLLDFVLASTNVNCYGAQDGTITITPTGGTRNVLANDYYSFDNGASWKPFPNNKPHTITGLTPGTYKVKVKDMNNCIARVQTLVNGEIQLGEEKVLEVTISQPLAPLVLSYTFKQNPTFNGAFNGKITASISGGTIKDDKSYDYKWVKTTGEEFTGTTQYNATDKTYTISLENAPAGEYKLTVTDKNYTAASNKTNCSIIESSQILTQPEPIVITLAETQSISCNTENADTDSDKFSDGILTATVVGGTPPYQYVWSKLNTNTNVWDILNDQTTNIAQNLSKGNYAVNVIDANEIEQGTYNTTTLVTAIPTTKEIAEPVKLNLVFDSKNVTCHEGNNGWAKANVTGGSAPYTYTWYNVKDGIINKNEISQVTAGEYYVEITDQRGCFIKGSIKVTEPALAVGIEYTEISTPTFAGATNGKIVAQITGGTPNSVDKSYTYEWKNSKGIRQTVSAELIDGIYTITLDNVPADDYFLTIRDENYNQSANQIINCSILDSQVTLNEPEPLKVIFEILNSISCNSNNEFGNDADTTPKDGQRDESQDGILIAHVTGGTPLLSSVNNGLPYYFYWKKQQADGSWMALADIKGETASNLSHGNYALNVKDGKGIVLVLGTYLNNELVEAIDATQFMQEPPKLAVTITKGDVFCNNGNDGWATANVTGGTAPYEYKWSNDVEIAKNTVLKAGEYWVFITDAKGCTTQESVTIIEPTAPLAIKYTTVLNPSFYKSTNGKIVVEVTGGTIFTNNTYSYEWKNSKGIVQTTTTANFNDGVYTISLNGLPEETYTLNVYDANYDAAINKSSCNISNSVITLEEPDPLEVTFEIVRTISCNVNNEFGNETDNNPLDNQRDESQDGILRAHVKGGIQLQPEINKGLPYIYTWKKKQNDGSWKVWNEETETLNNIAEGTYALNIEDANGIKLGTYTNNILEKEIDAIQYIAQPEKLNLTFTKLNATCNNGDDGWAEAHVSGGTRPYTYEWTNGETTAKIDNITTNNYFVLVTDAKGCVVQGSIFVGDPKGILTTETVKNPTCNKGNDGAIQLNVTGGNLPYTYVWNTGATTKDLNNLTAGNYEVTISCPDCCVYKKRFVLKDPNPIVIDLGKDRTLCNDQVLDLDASIADQDAQYSWTSTNGFTSNQPKVSVSKAGTYHVKVTSALGCIGEDEIVIKTSQAIISSEFLLSSQAYLDEEVILVNTSEPFGETTKWIIPAGVKTVEEKEKYITLKFNEIGTYSIGLQQTQGECFAVYNKNITVEKRSTLPNAGSAPKFIIDFIVTPNPSNGNFKAIINLENNSAVNLRLFSTTGEFTMQKKDSGKKNYEVDFSTSLQSGMYILVLETGQQTMVKKIIIY